MYDFNSMLEDVMNNGYQNIPLIDQLVIMEKDYFAKGVISSSFIHIIGGQGYLYKGTLIEDGRTVAVKVIPIHGMDGTYDPDRAVCI